VELGSSAPVDPGRADDGLGLLGGQKIRRLVIAALREAALKLVGS
jgi:hypothetical protein